MEANTTTSGVRATFADTENGELNVALKRIQEKIILPAYLPDKQRKIVFDPRMRSYLEQNPIIIEVEGVEHRFSSLNRFKDIQDSKSILNEALQKMESSNDWDNLATLLAGYKKAGIKLQPTHWGKIVRLAGEANNIYCIIECAQQASQTGLLLSNPETTIRILTFVNAKSINAPGDAVQASQALRWTEKVMDLLQRSEHADNEALTRDRLHFSRVVRGQVLLARAAAVKANQAAGEDVEQKLTLLRDEVELIKSLWKDADGQDVGKLPDFAAVNPIVERATKKAHNSQRALSGSGYVLALSQGVKGLASAREVLGDDAKDLQKIEESIVNHVKQFISESPEKTKESWIKEFEKTTA